MIGIENLGFSSPQIKEDKNLSDGSDQFDFVESFLVGSKNYIEIYDAESNSNDIGTSHLKESNIKIRESSYSKLNIAKDSFNGMQKTVDMLKYQKKLVSDKIRNPRMKS